VTPSPRPSNAWYVVDTMSTPWYLHTSTLMFQDNSILLTGGLYSSALVSTEKYVPSTGCFQTTKDTPRARRSHTADVLSAFSDYIFLRVALEPVEYGILLIF
jgi:hypothetical protein